MLNFSQILDFYLCHLVVVDVVVHVPPPAVDLVTHDVLNAESARESLARIRTLAEIWAHKSRPTRPARASVLPPRVQHADPFSKTLLVYRWVWERFTKK